MSEQNGPRQPLKEKDAEIERLTAENERLRKMLAKLTSHDRAEVEKYQFVLREKAAERRKG